MRDDILKPEDYIEPRCPLCEAPFGIKEEVRPVNQQRIIEKMDEYMAKRDYDGAKRHLLYWLEEARLGNDKRGELMIRNELIGHYRKTGEKENAFLNIEYALRLVDELGYKGDISAGTTYTNSATAYNAFGENEKAIELFGAAKDAYESNKNTSPKLLGGLYNNMALTLCVLKRFKEAALYYDKADEVMKKVLGGELERAITCLNRADLIEAEKGAEEGEGEIFALLDDAYDMLMNTSAPHDGYYAFVLEKCAPVFSHYGYFLAAREMEERSEKIYEGN